jgi:chromosome segregation ATPase
MINEAVLKALQARMRKLTEASISIAARAEQLRAAIEQAETAAKTISNEEAAAKRENDRLLGEAKALRVYIDGLARDGEAPALIAALQEEFGDLESKQREAAQQLERIKSRGNAIGQTLVISRAELEATEEKHRQAADQAMKLREHIEREAHT